MDNESIDILGVHGTPSSITAIQATCPLSTDDFIEDRLHYSSSGQRNASPSRASVHSVSSNITTSTTSAGVPHLKRKHGHKHMRQRLHSAQAILSNPDPSDSLASPPAGQPPANQPPSAKFAQYLPAPTELVRSNTAPSPKRPPARPPASHSSYGVETIDGPPPSFDTRRTYSQERVWKVDRSKSLRTTLASDRVEAQQQTVVEAKVLEHSKDPNIERPARPGLTTPLLVNSSPDTADTQSIPTPTDGEEIAVMEARSGNGLDLSHGKVDSDGSTESHKSEDLFLNIARVDSNRPSSSKSEKRKSRISLPFLSGARPSTSHTPESYQSQTDSSAPKPRADLSAYQTKRSSLQFGQLHGIEQVSENESTTDMSNSGHYGKRFSHAETIRPVQRSSTILRNNRFVSDTGYIYRAKSAEQNTTASTASTTAPSTVWDELDDLKSRIKKLELTGKLPPSSAAAMSTAERPRTATTAATTMSSSPKHNKNPGQLQPTIENVPPTVHPLLHEALSNARAVVSHDVYQKLQASAQDALQLASLTTFDSNIVRNGAAAGAERQIRRRTESLCRSLTELAIALAAEAKPAQSAVRPPSSEYHISPSVHPRSRRYSNTNDNTERPPVTVRVQSRLDNRRISSQYGYASARHTSPDLESPTALPQYPGSGPRTTRLAGALRTRRAPGMLDGAHDDEDQSPGVRPVSRAMTDLAVTRRTSRDHAALSREYTNQHPMPMNVETTSNARTPLPSNLSTNFISRRKFTSPGTQQAQADSSPLASRPSWARISVIHQETTPASDTLSEPPTSSRSVSTRRSLGFASRIGSSVGNRLRAAKTERIESRSHKDPPLSALDDVDYSSQVSSKAQ